MNRAAFFLTVVMFESVSNIAHAQEEGKSPHRVFEAYPADIQASIKAHDDQLFNAAQYVPGAAPYYVIVNTHHRWKPGQTVKVAFNGGTPDLYAKIKSAASDWTKPGVANVALKFTDDKGNYFHWSSSDKIYSGQVRIGFASGSLAGGYWSLIGTDSVDATIKGGAPNQASMNFDSFDKLMPEDWAGTVRHEFGHALGFEHEHQSPVDQCDFRFNDDPGYIKTKDQDGWYTVDKNGKYPGLYTYMGGKANYWPKQKVDDNLRSIPASSAYSPYLIGSFDKTSIMKYYYDAFMFVSGDKSPCYKPGENETLSAQDEVGASDAYPGDPSKAATAISQLDTILRSVSEFKGVSNQIRKSMENRLDALK
jgi:hypothetical protein